MNFYGIITKPLSGLWRSAHVALSARAHHRRICETQHGAALRDDRLSPLSSLARTPLLPRVHARPYYIPGAFSQIESYGLGLTNGADTCHDANAR